METTRYVPIKEDVKKIYVFKVVVQPDEDQYHAEVPTLQGCYSIGDTHEAALDNVKEAAQLWLEDMRDSGEQIPEETPTVLRRPPTTIFID